jgi:hypothetical protein
MTKILKKLMYNNYKKIYHYYIMILSFKVSFYYISYQFFIMKDYFDELELFDMGYNDSDNLKYGEKKKK